MNYKVIRKIIHGGGIYAKQGEIVEIANPELAKVWLAQKAIEAVAAPETKKKVI